MNYEDVLTDDVLKTLFPSDRANDFFDALYGDPNEGPYDIAVAFKGLDEEALHFEFQLKQRPGRCLACNLTYGLPEVFSRHPVINVTGLVQEICQLLDGEFKGKTWRLGHTKVLSTELHAIPLMIFFDR
jgi:hypothetical protein